MATLSVPPTERDQPPRLLALGSVFFWGTVLLLLMGVVAWIVIGWGGVDHFTDADAARVVERTKILQDRVTEDNKYLHDKPGWFKKDAGLVRVPIDEAMRMTLPVLQANKPHPAYPIAQSPPQNSAAPTSPDKGAGQDAKTPGKTNDSNPTASNPTVGQPSPAANNPGTPPVPGKDAQPPAPAAATNTSGPVATASPTPSGAQTAPLTNPPAQPAAGAGSTPIPNPQEPGASPAGTP